MSAKGGTMTTRAQTVVQVQNMKIHNKGGAAKARTDGSKAQQKPGVGIRKALANITNSDKPYFRKELKKDQLKKCATKEVPIVIEEEQCQHNHQSCVSLQTETSTNHLLNQILPLDDEKVETEDMSTKRGTMTARTQTLVQVQNLNIHNKGGTAKAEAGGSKAQQKPQVGIRKALANITNSEKPYFHKESKKNQLKKHANKEVPLVIEEELCQHNHQCCMSLQSETSTNLLNQILPLEDEKYSLELWSPKTPSTLLNQSKVNFESTPKYLNFTQSPVSLKYSSSIIH